MTNDVIDYALALRFAFKLRGVKLPSPRCNKYWQQGGLRAANFDRSGDIMKPTQGPQCGSANNLSARPLISWKVYVSRYVQDGCHGRQVEVWVAGTLRNKAYRCTLCSRLQAPRTRPHTTSLLHPFTGRATAAPRIWRAERKEMGKSKGLHRSTPIIRHREC